MNLYTLISVLFTLAIAIAYVNHHFIKIQTTIAIMAGSLLISFILIVLGQLGFATNFEQHTALMIQDLHFHDILINGMLSFLLFAGGLTIRLKDLRPQILEVSVLASMSTIASAFIVAGLAYLLLDVINYPVPFIYCMLFGALISPTDPIATLAMCKEIKAPKSLEVTIAGESLFNDGVGIVIFLTVLHVIETGGGTSVGSVIGLFMQQAAGGIFYGAALGFIGSALIKPIDDAKLEIMITLVIATGGYALAQSLNISGPLAMVVAGIWIGNYGRAKSLSRTAQRHLDSFWEIIDELLNAVLFLLMGFELLTLHLSHGVLIAALVMIPLVLIVRAITVVFPMAIFKLRKQYKPHTVNILIWGGLRGGLAVALALSTPQSPYRDLILIMTYAVVAFSIIIQGLTIKPLVELSKR
tara:strand:+ start:188446 stop:189684 length:1239 start_codon:yes stop_codon:yes gene_type:complete